MGKASRHKKERKAANLSNPVARSAVKIAARGGVIRELQQASSEDQVEALSKTVSPSKLGKALMKKAPSEMDKGIRRILKEGRTPTVDELCFEIRRNVASFRTMSEQAGVPLQWYEQLAEARMEANGVSEKTKPKKSFLARLLGR